MAKFNRELDFLLTDIRKEENQLMRIMGTSHGLSDPIARAREEGANQAYEFVINRLRKLREFHKQ